MEEHFSDKKKGSARPIKRGLREVDESKNQGEGKNDRQLQVSDSSP